MTPGAIAGTSNVESVVVVVARRARRGTRARATRALRRATRANDDDEDDGRSTNEYDGDIENGNKSEMKAKSKPLPGSGVNLYDPVATFSRFLTRRFGIVGGLTLVAALAAVEGGEILKALVQRDVDVDGEELEFERGVKARDSRLGGGATPKKGDFVGVNVVIEDWETSAEYVNTKKSGRPIAFTFERKPLLAPVCDAIEQGVRGMKRGGVRTVYAPSATAFGERGVVLPDGTRIPGNRDLKITITLEEVSPSYV